MERDGRALEHRIIAAIPSGSESGTGFLAALRDMLIGTDHDGR